MTASKALRPLIDKYNRPYWSALREGKIRVPRCRACAHLQFPMGPCCSECLGEEFDWVDCSGRGTMESYVVYHHAFHPSLANQLPYNVAEVQLEDGPKVITNIVGIPFDALQTGMPVRACFDRIDDELTLLRFKPAIGAEQ